MPIEEPLGYSFRNKYYLNRALTRKAYALEQKQQGKECDDQEIYRTLGDAVLKTALIDILIKKGYNTREGITDGKKRLEREEGLADISRSIGVGSYLKLGKGEERQKAGEEPYVLAETLEAIIGAVYLDGGFDAAMKIIIRLFKV